MTRVGHDLWWHYAGLGNKKAFWLNIDCCGQLVTWHQEHRHFKKRSLGLNYDGNMLVFRGTGTHVHSSAGVRALRGLMNTMKWVKTLGAGVMLVGLASLPAFAFQEQQGGSASTPPPAAAAPSAPAADVAPPAADFSAPNAASEADRGTEVSIPGLGKLGVLPKMDFGLELLYGANGQQDKMENDPGPETDDLRIRGSVKHRF
ncbi:hypothetical protein SAMN04488061_3594 [Filomicrobium insigne]|nr:hypothetical protein SAMN04488061_3594 [Filomicrobium insigne]